VGVIVDVLDLIESVPDQPRSTGQPVPPSGGEDAAAGAVAAIRHAARRQARVWAD
jgi:hypothetical protein